MLGTIHDNKALFMSIHVGTASNDDSTFEICTSMNQSPLIRCVETGKWFSLSWQEILELAEEAGITKED